jgi:hypothetical protein
LGHKTQTFPFQDIADFEVEASRSKITRRHQNITYRVVMVKTSGERVPLETVYSSSYDDKAKKARLYCSYLNLPGWEDKPSNLFQAAVQSQNVLTTETNKMQSGNTSGVSWWIEVHTVGDSQVTRWVSNDFTWPGQFLLVSQKPKGSPSFNSGGLLGNLMQMAYQQIMGIFGFLPGDMPGIERASAAGISDPRLEQDFATLTSDPVIAGKLLNPWVTAPLLRWAQQYPLRTVNTKDQFGQLVVLYSPRGVYVALFGSPSQPQLDDITEIGVELVKSQGGGQPIKSL